VQPAHSPIWKYQELLRLRALARTALRGAPPSRETVQSMRALAKHYPTSLRELDGVTECELKARLNEAEAPEGQLGLLIRYQRALRGALFWKPLLQRATNMSEGELRQLATQCEFEQDAQSWIEKLELLRQPRLSRAVLADVCAEADTAPEHFQTWAFGR
jgi:hypothetical protein